LLSESTIRTQSVLHIPAGTANWIGNDQAVVQCTAKIDLFQENAFPLQLLNTVAIFQLLLQRAE